MTISKLSPFALVSLLCLGISTGTVAQQELVELEVIDLTPGFMNFYEAAQEVDSAKERFELWQEHYDFVALPPGLPDRDDRARQMLGQAWPGYPDVIDRIDSGVDALDPKPVLNRVTALLEVEDELPTIRLLYYVGMLEGNAFFAPQADGSLLIALPAEMDPDHREVSMAHELIHAVHHSVSGLRHGPEGSVATVVLSEGLAMHGTHHLFPGRSLATHMSRGAEWVERCEKRATTIFAGIRDNLTQTGPDAVNRLTVGKGNAGMTGEAYCAGWHLVDRLMNNGHSLAELAHSDQPESWIEIALALTESADSSN